MKPRKKKKRIFTWEIAKEEKIKCCRLQEDSQGELCEKENEEEKKAIEERAKWATFEKIAKESYMEKRKKKKRKLKGREQSVAAL